MTFAWACIAYAQGVNISITLPANPPATTGQWGQGTNVFIINASGNMASMQSSDMLVFIKKGSTVVCGSNNVASAQPSGITSIAPKTWTGATANGLLGQNCSLTPGTYELCVQFYTKPLTQGRRELIAEKCKTFNIAGKEGGQSEICSPPNNINPTNGKLFTEAEVGKPITFNWSPLVKPQAGKITYHLMVWEVEDGQSNTQAMYNNLTVIDKEITAQTKYVAPPNTFEKREAKYVWRVIALNEEGKPICETSKSDATNFSVAQPLAKKENDEQLNTKCGDGDFETGKIDPTEWSGGYTEIDFDNASYVAPFNNTILPANGLPVDAPLKSVAGCYSGSQANENHQVIVSVGTDSKVPLLQKVPPSSVSNKYSLRLGNDCPQNGTERIVKKFLVGANDKELKFMYALVFQAPHDLTDNPSLWVKVYDASNTLVPNIVYLDPTSTTPKDRAVSDLSNPFWKIYVTKPDSSDFALWRDWTCARIDLSSLAGQIIRVEIMTNDCAQGAHYGYGYIDNFCVGCDNNPEPAVCCQEEIKVKSDKITVVKDNLNIQQNFNFSPTNIRSVVAEIISVEEENMDPNCMECTKFLTSPFHFVSANTATWGSNPPHKASPSNSTAKYPSKIIKWACNKQGNVKFDFNIGLPGTVTGSSCKHKGKICIRYFFTDDNCITCEKVICYNY